MSLNPPLKYPCNTRLEGRVQIWQSSKVLAAENAECVELVDAEQFLDEAMSARCE